ncbi:MAG TPA: bifunctional salicylyl-CoA 5-hydroxylase/oxidoreductase [Micromonosporaceae bacterium]|nr:bifunctional salicylyl-CoA 5-hydroxylase/oxidoreductase [Micromonosporaceae bacterium]
MRIAVIGGGPGGLYFAALAKQLDPARRITVWERNAPDDTFGFGVVLSDETLGGIEHADPVVYAAMAATFARWDDIDVHLRLGPRAAGRGSPEHVITSGGHGFAAMSRVALLGILQRRCQDLGVELRFATPAPDVDELRTTYDLVVAADGLNSTVRTKYADTFRPSYDVRACRYIWFGTDKVFDAFTFDVRRTEHGVMQVHAYPYDATGSTLIVEMHDDVWRRAGFTTADLPPGVSDEAAIAHCGEIFADLLDGHRLIGNNSKWISFTTIRCETWRHENVVLLGDAAHTAHFSIGSGTKLAMEDALALAACLAEQPDTRTALAAYEAERRPVVVSTQRAAQASLEWFENLGQYTHQAPPQFAFNLLTRSRRVTYENLRLRDPEFVARVDRWFADEAGAGPAAGQEPRPPMFYPFRLRELELKNRVIVSPMDMYVATDGLPNDFHLVHLGGKALGGAGLVMTEMVCVSPSGRITPGCTGLWTDEQAAAWARVVGFVHGHTTAKIGVQLGHSGRKGSTKLMWEGIDEPLPAGNWEVVGPSPIPYSPVNQTPRELTRADLDRITAQFVAAARRADAAGFDLLELHCAHGYLLSSFISPLTNTRTDGYGGPLAHRLRYPLEVFDAVRAAWPAGKPMSVRISATDWHPGGVDRADSIEVARAFTEHGVDAVDVSTGQVVSTERPAYGRSYQTPYADAIRNELRGRVAVVAVGAVSSYDDVNSLILAGRADLCALGRTHLYDPQWTLHSAAEQEYAGPGADWPLPFTAGRRRPQTGRTDGPKPRLELVRDAGAGATRHTRWRPERRP